MSWYANAWAARRQPGHVGTPELLTSAGLAEIVDCRGGTSPPLFQALERALRRLQLVVFVQRTAADNL